MRRAIVTAAAARKARDIAAVVPIVAIALFMPPLVHLFGSESGIFGIPAIVLYLFGIWIVAIVVTRWNVRRLDRPAADLPMPIDPKDAPP